MIYYFYEWFHLHYSKRKQFLYSLYKLFYRLKLLNYENLLSRTIIRVYKLA